MNLTSGTLLGGRLRYDQPAEGYRTGLEPVLLAASIPARPGERVVEAGCGAGAGLLCLAARVPGIHGLGIERDAALAALAAANFAANECATLRAEAADLTAWQCETPFDHAFANPPWHDGAGTASPDAARRAAKRSSPGLLEAWTVRMARALRPRGTLSLILPAGSLAQAIAALGAAKCRGVTVVPVWPYAGKPARLMIVRAVYLGSGCDGIAPGLVLHAGAGFTEAADGILRNGQSMKVK